MAKEDLLEWLDRHALKKIQYSQAEKRKYFESVIDDYVKKKDNNLTELAIGCYRLKEQIESHITQLEENTAKTEYFDPHKYSFKTHWPQRVRRSVFFNTFQNFVCFCKNFHS